MEVSNQGLDGLKKTLIGLGVVLAVVLLPTLVFLALGEEVAAAICGTFTVGTILAFTHVLAFAGGAWYTRGTMQMGADVALRAQETNDRWDERKTAAFGRLMVEGARIGRTASTLEGGPALPLPSQGMDWLPSMAAFQDEEEDWRTS